MLIVSGIPVEVCKKRIKNMHLYVKPPDGRVVVSAPLCMSNKTIERFVKSKLAWIEKQRTKIQGRHYQVGREYKTGERLSVWGRPYLLQVEPGSRYTLELSEDTATARLTAREDSTVAQRERFVREWYREQLKTEIARLLPVWEKRMGLKASSWQTKYMTSRWGTCNTKVGRLWFNVQLAQKAPECLEYVVVHELAHLAEKGHGERFKAIMDTYLPTWRAIRATMNA